MRNKKAQTESYSFLIGLLITFLMLTSIGCVTYQLYSKKTESEESFNALTEKIKTLKEGEEGKIPIYLDEDHIIVGFKSSEKEVKYDPTQGNDMYGPYHKCYAWRTEQLRELIIERPEKCKGKGCICLCEYKNNQIKQEPNAFGDSGIAITKEVCNDPEDKCETEDVDQYNFEGEECPIAFIAGLKINSGLTNRIEPRGIKAAYYKKTGKTIIFGDKQPTKKEREEQALEPVKERLANLDEEIFKGEPTLMTLEEEGIKDNAKTLKEAPTTLLKGQYEKILEKDVKTIKSEMNSLASDEKGKILYFTEINMRDLDEDEFYKYMYPHYAIIEQKIRESEEKFDVKTGIKPSDFDIRVVAEEGCSLSLEEDDDTVYKDLMECANNIKQGKKINKPFLALFIGPDFQTKDRSLGFTDSKNLILTQTPYNLVTAHEFGHVISLCDEYNYKTWMKQNSKLIAKKGKGCLNPYPLCCSDHPLWQDNTKEYKEYIEERKIGRNCMPDYSQISEDAKNQYKTKEEYEKYLNTLDLCAGHVCKPKKEQQCRGIMGGNQNSFSKLVAGSIERLYIDPDMPEDYLAMQTLPI